MTFINCKYCKNDEHDFVDNCGATSPFSYRPFVKLDRRTCAYGGPDVVARHKCKYYKSKEEEKYALFAEETTLIPVHEYSMGCYGYFESNTWIKAQSQLTSPMPLEELTAKCSGLIDDPVWKEHVKIKRVEGK
jgi:hypothetical protein